MSRTMKRQNSIGALMGVAAALAAASPGIARAQQGDEDPASSMEEIVVTATKRSTTLQDTPLSVQAVNGEMLEQLGAESFEDYIALVPGLSAVDQGSAGPKLTLRGLATSQFQETQATVGIYVDEIPVTDSGGQAPAFLTAFNLRLHDIDRIEVLRGPQATLFGAGSIGGTVRFITNQPNSDQFEAGAEASGWDGSNRGLSYGANGYINLPLAQDAAALRAVAYYEDNDGWIDNVVTGERGVNTEEVVGGRISSLVRPGENLGIVGHFLTQKTERGGFAAETLSLGENLQDRATREPYRDEADLYNLTATLDLGRAELISSSSLVDRRTHARLDITSQIEPFFPGQLAQQQSTTEQDEFDQELRLVSTGDGALQWIVGAYYSNLDRTFTQNLAAPGVDAAFGNIAADAGFPDVLFHNVQDTNFEERAVFGETTYAFSEALELTLGLRYFEIDIQSQSNAGGFFNGGNSTSSGGGSESDVLPKFNLAYRVSEDDLVYATISRGYRRGGPNETVPTTNSSCAVDLAAIGLSSAPTSFGSDTVWNYEFGARTGWFNNRLTLNGDVFYLDWEGLPATKFLNCGFIFTVNAGQARSMGAELELQAYITDSFSLFGTFAYTDSKLLEDIPELGGSEGDRAPGVPRVTWSLAAIYEGESLFGRASYQHVGSSYTQFDEASAERLTGYDVIDVSVGIHGDNWEIGAFVDNLTDERGIVNAFNTPFANFVVRTPPRAFGVRMRVHY